MTARDAICTAIRTRRRLAFDYHGEHRIVEPYCHGTSTRGQEVLRAVQIGGGTKTGGLGFGKLFLVAEIANPHVTTTPFAASDPHYNPQDSAMVTIHCHV